MNFTIHAFFSLAICISSECDIPYSVAELPWRSELGNHRVRIYVSEKSDAVLAKIQWRRRDPKPEHQDNAHKMADIPKEYIENSQRQTKAQSQTKLKQKNDNQ